MLSSNKLERYARKWQAIKARQKIFQRFVLKLIRDVSFREKWCFGTGS